MTIKELGYSFRDNSNDKSRYRCHKYYLVNDKTNEEIGFNTKYALCKFLVIINMNDKEHLHYLDCQNPSKKRIKRRNRLMNITYNKVTNN